jgi:hypothetical protein
MNGGSLTKMRATEALFLGPAQPPGIEGVPKAANATRRRALYVSDVTESSLCLGHIDSCRRL